MPPSHSGDDGRAESSKGLLKNWFRLGIVTPSPSKTLAAADACISAMLSLAIEKSRVQRVAQTVRRSFSLFLEVAREDRCRR